MSGAREPRVVAGERTAGRRPTMINRRRALDILEPLGLRRLARWATRGRLRILCYHGFSLRDEHLFRPKLYITEKTFRRRLEQLKKSGFEVLPLAGALDRLVADSLPDRAAVITIDDGFCGILPVAAPMLEEFGYPYTIYVTSYYSALQQPVFRLAVQYLGWRSGAAPDLARLGVTLDPAQKHVLRDGTVRDGWEAAVIAHGEAAGTEGERTDLLERLAGQLGVDWGDIVSSRILHILDEHEIAALAASGVDMQLHTHTHRFPGDAAALGREIERNRDYLRSITGVNPVHLCYPSGHYRTEMIPTLREHGVLSATTCHRGLAGPQDPLHLLPRILDREALSHADVCSDLDGVLPLLRTWKDRVRRTGARA